MLSVLSTPAIDHGTVVGSLNLYSRQAEAFDQRAGDAAFVFAAEIANALTKSATLGTAKITRDNLQEGHDESVVIARAHGVLMAVNECSAAQARDLMQRASDANGERLVTTADRILSTLREDDVTAESRR